MSEMGRHRQRQSDEATIRVSGSIFANAYAIMASIILYLIFLPPSLTENEMATSLFSPRGTDAANIQRRLPI